LSKEITQTVIHECDDPQDAFDKYNEKRTAEPNKKFGFADVRTMLDPPPTKFRYIVFELVEH
jgi:hypothetical protein